MDLVAHHADLNYDALVEEAIGAADGPLALYGVLLDAASGYMFRKAWQQAKACADRGMALLPELDKLDLPAPMQTFSIGIGSGTGKVDFSVPPRDPHERLRYQLERLLAIIEPHLAGSA